jgi:glucokinase
MQVLAGDIGGTKTILAAAEVEGCRVKLLREKRFASGDYDDFRELAQSFLSDTELEASRACFGVAGPVAGGRSRVTNLPWVLEEDELSRSLELDRVRLINDFVAIAYGIEALSSDGGTLAVVGAGTGLGESFSVMSHQGERVAVASEGGHADFAPRNELEIELLRWMLGKFGRVSYERVVSGPGLRDIFTFLRDSGRGEESEELRKAIEDEGDAAPVIHRFADEKKDPLCEASMNLFTSVYGAEAGNLALKVLATGGVYLAGGIAPRMVNRLKRETFRKAFVGKGRLSPVIEAIPVHVITQPKVGLLGAAVAATRG